MVLALRPNIVLFVCAFVYAVFGRRYTRFRPVDTDGKLDHSDKKVLRGDVTRLSGNNLIGGIRVGFKAFYEVWGTSNV